MNNGVSLINIHHPEGDGAVPEGLNPDSLETIEIEIPMTPEQILRSLENGYFMTHQEQAEAAQYIRQLQQENLTMLGKREWVGLTDDEVDLILWQGVFDAKDIRAIEAKLKEKNGAL